MLKVVIFTAPWCVTCQRLEPTMEELKQENPDVKFTTIDVNEHGDIAVCLGVTSIPTVVFMKDNKELTRFIGVAAKIYIQELINKYE